MTTTTVRIRELNPVAAEVTPEDGYVYLKLTDDAGASGGHMSKRETAELIAALSLALAECDDE